MKFITLIFLCFLAFGMNAQNIQIQGDSVVVFIDQNGKKVELDSTKIQKEIDNISKEIDATNQKLKDVEVVRAEILELKTKQIEKLNTFFDLRYWHFRLKKQIDDKKGK